jgi:putative DNA-invertase from lambdoid prophage Rac
MAAAKARGRKIGRQPGQRPSDRLAPKVLQLAREGLSYRRIARLVGLSKNTVAAIIGRRGLAPPNRRVAELQPPTRLGGDGAGSLGPAIERSSA